MNWLLYARAPSSVLGASAASACTTNSCPCRRLSRLSRSSRWRRSSAWSRGTHTRASKCEAQRRHHSCVPARRTMDGVDEAGGLWGLLRPPWLLVAAPDGDESADDDDDDRLRRRVDDDLLRRLLVFFLSRLDRFLGDLDRFLSFAPRCRRRLCLSSLWSLCLCLPRRGRDRAADGDLERDRERVWPPAPERRLPDADCRPLSLCLLVSRAGGRLPLLPVGRALVAAQPGTGRTPAARPVAARCAGSRRPASTTCPGGPRPALASSTRLTTANGSLDPFRLARNHTSTFTRRGYKVAIGPQPRHGAHLSSLCRAYVAAPSFNALPLLSLSGACPGSKWYHGCVGGNAGRSL